jgi:hypothetical protein
MALRAISDPVASCRKEFVYRMQYSFIFADSRIPDPGVKKAPDPGSGSATLLFLSDPDPNQNSKPVLVEQKFPVPAVPAPQHDWSAA